MLLSALCMHLNGLVRKLRGLLTPRSATGQTAAQRLGAAGEREAERFLTALGHRTIARNQRTRQGEVDLIVESADGAIVFVEVKTRHAQGHWKGEHAITARKKRRMLQCAQTLAKKHRWGGRALRIDIIVVEHGTEGTKPIIRHHRNAVTLNDLR